ncbi:uncharacterized protein LOC142984630 [Anticarsia gemmatalis]|uniref:uncharacterized protein LOC142984630 n=1 Tax=Anticarsia gemmatalis TaxID=129554 RepID=UPI003F768BA1
MEVLMKPMSENPKKRKRTAKTKTTSEPKQMKTDTEAIVSSLPVTPEKSANKTKNLRVQFPKTVKSKKNKDDLGEDSSKYPILKDEELVQKFLKVPMSNNQKGRIRQAIKESLQGTSNAIVPEIVHNKIQAILKASDNLTDSQLRRIRILYNLLKTALKGADITGDLSPEPKKPKKIKTDDSPKLEKDVVKKDKKDLQKKKGPKRYVVFLGNLPIDIDKERIMAHFSEMNEQIKDIRIPKVKDGKKSAIAYVELTNEPSYEFALSKHHSMLGNKRINVLYTAQKNGKITKADAKSKSAKLIALQKSGKLVGSVPLAKKRSQRRLKMKRALAKNDA